MTKGTLAVSVVTAAALASLSFSSIAFPGRSGDADVSARTPADTPAAAASTDHDHKGADSQGYIVEASSTDLAAAAVQAAGGRVLSRLGIIDAVEASLTEAQRAQVLRAAGIKQVTPNAVVRTNAAASVRDNFETSSFANNDGTHRWWGDWVETNDDNQPWGGKIAMWPEKGGMRLIVGSNGAISRRVATPTSSPSVTLTLKYQRVSLEAGEYLAVQASANGGATWTEVGRISGAGSDSGLVTKSYSLTAYKGRNTAIRFVGSMSESFPGDYVILDDVEIGYSTTYGSGDPQPVDVNARNLHSSGNRGRDVGVAVIDTGYWKLDSLDKDTAGNGRVASQYDAVTNTVVSSWSAVSTDTTGHGTHVTSLIASSRKRASDGAYFGVAPDARIISIKAFGEDGSSTYATVIRAIDYVITNKNPLAIRVLNLSLGAPARSRYWDDPLNKAVMRAWQSGIVVVVSAGNSGPLPQTVGVPGNVPYVITVGAMTDNYTSSKNDDRLASFSSTGPTYEGFVKPDLVAPGGHAWGFMPTFAKIAVDHPTYMNNGDFFTMSGTSQSAAVVSGVAALVLYQYPGLTPDQVKCRIISSARPAVDANGKLAYSVLQQGTGMVDADRAVKSTNNTCANQGLNINADLAGTQHFMGSVRQRADGTFTVSTPSGAINDQGFLWDHGYLWGKGYLWANGYLWPAGYLWANGYLWAAGKDIPWVGGYPANIGSSVGSTSSMSINFWVNQE